jgi:restriction system protein
MREYYQVRLGPRGVHADACFAGNFIGTDFDPEEDLSGKFPDDWRPFNKQFIPAYMAANPGKSRIGAGLACATLWIVSKGIRRGDLVLCPDGVGGYRVGEVNGDYFFAPGEVLFHRRPVTWLNTTIDRSSMSEGLRNCIRSIGTVCNLGRAGFGEEIEKLISGTTRTGLVASDPSVEDPVSFALEEHLEAFLVKNWAGTVFGKHYDIYSEDGEIVGQQYPTDTGPLDILAISRDKKRLLVVELKKGRASDSVVGQILRYMSYVQEELAEPGQTVEGAIVAHEDDARIRRALAMTSNIGFYRYQLGFSLVKC